MKRTIIISLILLFSLSFRLEAQKVYLVAVGVSDYPGSVNDLKLPAQDAKAIYRLYKTNTNSTAVLLINSAANKGRILREMRNLFNKARSGDIVVLFLSCHGYKGGFYVYDDYLRYDEIRSVFSECVSKNKIIFADACFSGDIREEGSAGTNHSKDNIMLFLSSRSNEYSIESPNMKNGFFTACLIRALKGGADFDRNKVITAKELFKAVSSSVKNLSSNMQHPVMWGNFSDNMPVMIWK